LVLNDQVRANAALIERNEVFTGTLENVEEW
jgi:hypothetical protein